MAAPHLAPPRAMASLLLPCGIFFLVVFFFFFLGKTGTVRILEQGAAPPPVATAARAWGTPTMAAVGTSTTCGSSTASAGGSMAGVSPSGDMAAGPLLPPRHHRRRLLLPFPGGALELATVAPRRRRATLLALGNGAPDFFASVVGLSSVLGGAFFVSTVVVGVISVAVGGGAVTVAVDRFCFLRDLCFLAAALCSLTAVLAVGRINLWGPSSSSPSTSSTSRYLHDSLLQEIPLEGLSASLLAGEEEKQDLEGGAREEPKSPRRRGWWRSLLAAPLHLPRRLTIPVVSEERWSKPFALLLAGGLLGLILGGAAVATTERSLPPKGLLQLPWLAVGFLMSIVWAYLAAGELVALLVSLGPNVAMAVYGGAPGAQVAFSGCYAGPIFNTLVGLGPSLLIPVPAENSSYQLLGFMMAGLLWAAVILTRREMKVDRVLGLGLLTIYCSFLSVRVSDSLGWL
ncbi:unnamed protein product [Spirodela intermedia]|uniref:Sodium/calcium exchanger membrane region domain-containing protein n=1 Tax=Spirodela intermedia TaxID=51605 RepID=A0ABN7E952_SPIIN|nr:unnamed protein product [Spirodela intermedia]